MLPNVVVRSVVMFTFGTVAFLECFPNLSALLCDSQKLLTDCFTPEEEVLFLLWSLSVRNPCVTEGLRVRCGPELKSRSWISVRT